MATIDDVLRAWFGDPARDRGDLEEKERRWYRGGETEARRLADLFAVDVERALRGELDEWSTTNRGRLALVLLLDQVTRSIYAGTPRMLAGDAKAVSLAKDTLDAGLPADLSFEERHFLIMPLLHAENVVDLERAGIEFERNGVLSPPWGRFFAEAGMEQSRKYAAVVERFGRFPHRNVALGRRSTAEEEQFLQDWAEKAPPSFTRGS